MEPRSQEPKTTKPQSEEKPKRFRIIKLEERIAPKGTTDTVNTQSCFLCTYGCNLTHPPGHCK